MDKKIEEEHKRHNDYFGPVNTEDKNKDVDGDPKVVKAKKKKQRKRLSENIEEDCGKIAKM